MRTFWHAQLGYPTTALRDEAHDAFAAGVQPHIDSGQVTPATLDSAPSIPAGLVTDQTVDGLPGLAFGYDIAQGFDSTDAFAGLWDTVQGPSEGGTQGIVTVL